LVSIFQAIQEISFKKENGYFYRGKLNFDKIYFELVIQLLKKLPLEKHTKVKIIIDTRKHKGGILGKKRFTDGILGFFESEYQETIFEFKLQPSSTDVLLELADFISNRFYRAYAKNDEKYFNDLGDKIIKLKGTLNF